MGEENRRFFLFPSLSNSPSLSPSNFNNSPHQARHPGPDRAVPPCRLVEGDALVRDAVIVAAVAATARESAAGRCRSCPPRERRRRVGPQARRGCPGAGGEHGRGEEEKEEGEEEELLSECRKKFLLLLLRD